MKFNKITGAIALTLAASSIPAMAVNVRTARPVQSSSMSEQQFNQMDRSGDGMVSLAEWPRDRAAFDRLDLNRDGLLTRAEWRQAFNSNSAPSGWNAMDRNRDGVISRNEWTGTQAEFDRLNTDRDSVLTPAELRNSGTWANRGGKAKRFKGMDRNKDGVITRDEWRGNDQSFRQHDLNGDNMLSGDELRGRGRDKDDDDQDDDEGHHKNKKHDKHDN